MRINNRYPGANPRRASDVEKVGPDRFLLRPWSEDGDGNYKFCLNVEVINESADPVEVDLLIDWEDIEYMDCRDYVLVGRDEEWRSFRGTTDGMVSTVRAEVPPGDWYVGLHPVYDFEMLEDDRRMAIDAGFTCRPIGESRDGREIAALTAGRADAPAVFIVSRFHPYETAGSFCVSEILRVLAADLHDGGPLTEAFSFAVVPMPNPDGTASGCCKRTRRGGPDLCHEGADSDDPAGKALASFLAEVAPRGYLDLHGWMYRNHDGLSYSHRPERDAFVAALADDPIFNKEWKGTDRSPKPDVPGDFYMRASRDHGAVCLVISPSWFGRSVPQMREFGRKVLGALCGVLQG